MERPIDRSMGTGYCKLAVINGCRGALTFAGLAMLDRSGRIPVVTFPTIVTVSSCRKMPALQTNASADASRQLVQFHVESALSRVEIAVALWNEYTIIRPIAFRSKMYNFLKHIGSSKWIINPIQCDIPGLYSEVI